MSISFRLPAYADRHMESAWERQNRLLAVALAASIAVHVAAIAIAPGARDSIEPLRPPLEVVLVRPPVPAPMIQEPPQPPREIRRAAPLRAPKQPVAKPVERAPEPQLMLALPDSVPSVPATFSVPLPVIEPPSLPSEPRPSAAVTAPPSPPRAPAVTVPASFNAAYLRNAPPRYPLIARRNGVEGTVRLKVLVTREGRAAQVDIDRTSGSSVLDSAALEAVRNWQFAPARRGQEPIESWVLVPVVFKLENAS